MPATYTFGEGQLSKALPKHAKYQITHNHLILANYHHLAAMTLKLKIKIVLFLACFLYNRCGICRFEKVPGIILKTFLYLDRRISFAFKKLSILFYKSALLTEGKMVSCYEWWNCQFVNLEVTFEAFEFHAPELSTYCPIRAKNITTSETFVKLPYLPLISFQRVNFFKSLWHFFAFCMRCI